MDIWEDLEILPRFHAAGVPKVPKSFWDNVDIRRGAEWETGIHLTFKHSVFTDEVFKNENNLFKYKQEQFMNSLPRGVQTIEYEYEYPKNPKSVDVSKIKIDHQKTSDFFDFFFKKKTQYYLASKSLNRQDFLLLISSLEDRYDSVSRGEILRDATKEYYREGSLLGKKFLEATAQVKKLSDACSTSTYRTKMEENRWYKTFCELDIDSKTFDKDIFLKNTHKTYLNACSTHQSIVEELKKKDLDHSNASQISLFHNFALVLDKQKTFLFGIWDNLLNKILDSKKEVEAHKTHNKDLTEPPRTPVNYEFFPYFSWVDEEISPYDSKNLLPLFSDIMNLTKESPKIIKPLCVPFDLIFGRYNNPSTCKFLHIQFNNMGQVLKYIESTASSKHKTWTPDKKKAAELNTYLAPKFLAISLTDFKPVHLVRYPQFLFDYMSEMSEYLKMFYFSELCPEQYSIKLPAHSWKTADNYRFIISILTKTDSGILENSPLKMFEQCVSTINECKIFFNKQTALLKNKEIFSLIENVANTLRSDAKNKTDILTKKNILKVLNYVSQKPDAMTVTEAQNHLFPLLENFHKFNILAGNFHNKRRFLALAEDVLFVMNSSLNIYKNIFLYYGSFWDVSTYFDTLDKELTRLNDEMLASNLIRQQHMTSIIDFINKKDLLLNYEEYDLRANPHSTPYLKSLKSLQKKLVQNQVQKQEQEQDYLIDVEIILDSSKGSNSSANKNSEPVKYKSKKFKWSDISL